MKRARTAFSRKSLLESFPSNPTTEPLLILAICTGNRLNCMAENFTGLDRANSLEKNLIFGLMDKPLIISGLRAVAPTLDSPLSKTFKIISFPL